MAKGHKTGGGSRKGKPNKSTEVKRTLGAEVLPDKLEKELWSEFLTSDDAHIKWEAFKLAKQYKSGMPPKALSDKDSGLSPCDYFSPRVSFLFSTLNVLERLVQANNFDAKL